MAPDVSIVRSGVRGSAATMAANATDLTGESEASKSAEDACADVGGPSLASGVAESLLLGETRLLRVADEHGDDISIKLVNFSPTSI